METTEITVIGRSFEGDATAAYADALQFADRVYKIATSKRMRRRARSRYEWLVTFEVYGRWDGRPVR